ncbi:MAG: GNAT family N-acetyltransferase [Tissierella sp.]|nr:GNAT family N-acetyltransferase [Tissierella sp.]
MIRIRTRIANVEDATSISTIHAKSWKEAYKGLLPNKYLNEIKDTRWVDMITKGLIDNTMKAWIAIIEDEIIACTCIGDSRYKGYENQLELISIYVLPEYWNVGAGSLLIDEVLKYAEDNDYVEVGLWVLDGNNQAIRFYEKNGFLSNGDTISCTIGEKHTNEKRYIKKLI